jgi:hypothetical protein
MSTYSPISDLPWPERERAQHNTHENSADAGRVRPKLTRVQIEALVSGDFTPIRLGPELVHQLNLAWSGSGQRLHMLHVEVVNTPVRCPRCHDRALYRKERRGFWQRKVYAVLGLFPWHCISCRKTTLLRVRGADYVETSALPRDEERERAREAA